MSYTWDCVAGMCYFCSKTFSWCCSDPDCEPNNDTMWWKRIWWSRGFQILMETCSSDCWVCKNLSTQHCKISAELLFFNSGGFSKKSTPLHRWRENLPGYQFHYLSIVLLLILLTGYNDVILVIIWQDLSLHSQMTVREFLFDYIQEKVIFPFQLPDQVLSFYVLRWSSYLSFDCIPLLLPVSYQFRIESVIPVQGR